MIKYRLVILASSLVKSGPNNQNYYILKYLDRSRFEPYILTISPEPKNSMKYLFEELNIPIIQINSSRKYGVINIKNTLARILFEISPSIIHSFGVRANYFANKMPYENVISIRNYPPNDFPDKLGKIRGKMIARRYIQLIKRFKNRVACSYSIADEFMHEEGIALDVIANGVDINKYKPVTKLKKMNLRKSLGLPMDKYIFICAGDLIPRKNTDVVINGFNELGREDAYLVIAGAGGESCKLKLISSKNIMFAGSVTNISDYYSSVDCFISASVSEGLPNSVLEAMASNLPCILSKIPPHIEIIKNDDQGYGYTFNTGSASDLSKKMAAIINNSQEFNFNKSRDYIISHYNGQSMSIAYQTLYENVILRMIPKV